MPITSDDLVPLGQVRVRLTELVEEAPAGREKIVTRNGEGKVALINARRVKRHEKLTPLRH